MDAQRIVPIALCGVLLFGCTSDAVAPSGEAAPEGALQVSPRLMASTLKDGPTRSIFVTYRSNAPTTRLQTVMSKGVRAGGEIANARILALVVYAEARDSIIEGLRRISWIEAVDTSADDFTPQADILPWGISNTGADQVSGLFGNRGAGIKVGFIDTGVDCSHPDLSARVVGGYDFVNMSATYCVYSTPHGTGVAGILAAASNGSGVIGMAPEANLYSLRICSTSSCPNASLALALQWAADNAMQVVSVSLANCGPTVPSPVSVAAANAYAAGAIVVAAAGNGIDSGCNPFTMQVSGLARLPNVIAVSAMKSDFTTPSSYQYGPEVDLAAPTNVTTDSLSGYTWTFGGTSAATPHVAGAVALLRKKGWTAGEVFGRLTTESVDRGAAGKDNYFGYGSLDALTAVQPRPYISNIVSCYTPPLYAGNCQLTAVFANGIAPFQVKWEVTYSNGSHSPINTGFISGASYTIPVPAGSYSISVTATPKENGVRTRTGSPTINYYPVCPGGGDYANGSMGGPVPNAVCP